MTERRSMFITWTDGRKAAYPFTHDEVANGELHLWTEYPGVGTIGPRVYDEYWFPLASIRVRTTWNGAD